MSEATPDKNKHSIFSLFKSVSAGFFGVQSNSNREKDFKEGKISHFIIVGVICTALFIAALIAVVSAVIPSS